MAGLNSTGGVVCVFHVCVGYVCVCSVCLCVSVLVCVLTGGVVCAFRVSVGLCLRVCVVCVCVCVGVCVELNSSLQGYSKFGFIRWAVLNPTLSLYIYIHAYTCAYMYIDINRYTHAYTCVYMYVDINRCIYNLLHRATASWSGRWWASIRPAASLSRCCSNTRPTHSRTSPRLSVSSSTCCSRVTGKNSTCSFIYIYTCMYVCIYI